MKKIVITLSLFFVFLALIFISPASACHFCALDITADCEGYTVSGEVACNWIFHPGFEVSYDLNVNYVNGQGAQASFPVFGFATVMVESDETNLCIPFEISGEWEEEFCGDVSISGSAVAVSVKNSAQIDFADFETVELFCPCACTRTPGYWKNPKKEWPVGSLVIGGVTYTRDELLVLLKLPAKEHEIFGKDVKLFHHLVAAMLNVAADSANNTPFVAGLINDANMYFEFGTWGVMSPKEMKDALDDFNNSGEYYCD